MYTLRRFDDNFKLASRWTISNVVLKEHKNCNNGIWIQYQRLITSPSDPQQLRLWIQYQRLITSPSDPQQLHLKMYESVKGVLAIAGIS